MNSIIFLFTNDRVKVFFIIFQNPLHHENVDTLMG